MQIRFQFFDPAQPIHYVREILAGLTTSFAMVPEVISFAIFAGLSPLTGLYGAFIIGLVTALTGGRPGMISGAAGATAVVIAALVQSHGVQYVLATFILAGFLQLWVGIFKLGKFIRLVPQPVMYGFVNGLAIVIFMAQIRQFKAPDAQGNMQWMTGTPFWTMLGLVLLAMALIWAIPKFTKRIPASLIAIVVLSFLVIGLHIETRTVGDIAAIQGGFPAFHIPGIPWTWETLQIIFPYALIVAGVGLVESLLTLNLVDEMTGTRGRSNQEAAAQGAGNILSGFFSGMGGCAMIGQSFINVTSGGRTRISGIVAALAILVFVVFGSGIIEQLPMAALTGVMIMVAIGTFEWSSFRTWNKMPRTDVFVIVVVTLITVLMHNLALAVLIGVIISALTFAWENAKRIRARKYTDETGTKHYEISGPLFFGSVAAFYEKFDPKNDPENIVIDFAESRIADMSGIEAVNILTERYRKAGKQVSLTHLSPDCLHLLRDADKLITVNILEDPNWKVAVD